MWLRCLSADVQGCRTDFDAPVCRCFENAISLRHYLGTISNSNLEAIVRQQKEILPILTLRATKWLGFTSHDVLSSLWWLRMSSAKTLGGHSDEHSHQEEVLH